MGRADPKYRGLMRRFRRLLRAAVMASFALAVWTLARPAAAATAPLAPFCDDRGASAIAPSPTLEATDEAIRRTRATACDVGELTAFASIARGHGVPEARFEATARALVTAVLPLSDFAGSLVDGRCAVSASRRGVHSRIERPPRGTRTRATKY